MQKEFYHDVLLTEIFRYIKIRGMDPENLDEYSAAVYAVWYTQNPLGVPARDNISNIEEEEEDEIFLDMASIRKNYGSLRLNEPLKRRHAVRRIKGVRFTAHTHPEEPLDPSPDDLLIYAQIARSDQTSGASKDQPIHFIVDGYRCRRVDNAPDEK